MPRAGDEYSLPAGTAAVSSTTANSAHVNARFADLEAEQNLARPVSKGGTGATSAPAALANLGLTATAAEINTLDGITASTAELNILDGVTATTAELNVLDGIPGTLTATEIGYLDGVTSPIQTQLDGKVAVLADPGADRIRFWDDSAGAEAYLTVGAGLAISGTTLTGAGVGEAQTWQDMTASRAFGTSYQNTTGGPITFNPRATAAGGSHISLETSPDNSTWTVVYKVNHNVGSTWTDSSMGSVVVPDTFYYRCRSVSGTNTLTSWMELRP